jgi:hypothetical protein
MNGSYIQNQLSIPTTIYLKDLLNTNSCLSKIKTSSISSVLGLLISLLVLSAVCQTPMSFILSYAQESSPGESPIGNTLPSEKAPSIAQNQEKKTTTQNTTTESQIPRQVTTINNTASAHVAKATGRLPFNNTLLPKSIQTDLGTEQ